MLDQSSKPPPSHYLPAFTTARGTVQMAACGAFIHEREHATEPSCPRCAAWLQQEARDEASLFASMGYEMNGRGVMVPGPTGKGGPF
jgi:predicted RNA-binding Zn-ribbon protein involved in translation (DUF1610 family)